MDRKGKAQRALGAWVLVSLCLAYFHEPGRTEAQAWLIARTAGSVGELLYRSSAEGAGPLYYLWLWPWANLLPSAFPSALFWLSWVGSLFAVGWLLFSDLVPLRVAVLTAFGFLLGYESAAQAHLYGWGAFFLLAGIHRDRNSRPQSAAAFLGAACLIQLPYAVAAVIWCGFRGYGKRSGKEYLPVLGAAALAWWHGGVPKVLPPFGRHEAALVVFLFTLAATGVAWSRGWIRGLVYAGLLGSLAVGVWAGGQDLFLVYGDGMGAARTIAGIARAEQKEPRLFAVDDSFALVVAARLNQSLWASDAPLGCPYFPGKCPDTIRKEKDIWSRLVVADVCPSQVSCFFVGGSDQAEPFPLTKGRWEKVFLPSDSLSRENLVVYHLSRK